MAQNTAFDIGAVEAQALRDRASGTATLALSRAQLAYLPFKRVADVVLAVVLLALTLPLMAVLGAAIVLDSPGGFLFRQERIGWRGRPFTIFKLRSMVAGSPRYAHKVGTRSPHVTRVGRFLRLSGMDELPQLVNVIAGDLSLIGPRPEMRFIVDTYEPWQHERHLIRPGISGLWQVHHASDEPLHLGIRHDLEYIQHMGPMLDLRIAARTIWVVVRGAVTGLRSLTAPPFDATPVVSDAD